MVTLFTTQGMNQKWMGPGTVIGWAVKQVLMKHEITISYTMLVRMTPGEMT